MSINIKNREAERLLASLKARTGRGTSEIVLDLLRREQARLAAADAARVDTALHRLARFRATVDALPVLDCRPADEILGYGEDGLPS